VSAGGGWPGAVRPRVRIVLVGRAPEDALARALGRGVEIESVRALGAPAGALEIVLAPSMLAPLRAAVRGRARVHVRSRAGGGYLAHLVLGRPGLWLGGVAFVAALGVLGSMVWQVRVEGVAPALGRTLAAAAATQGIRPGAWRASIDTDRAARALERRVPAVSWAGLGLDGGLVMIRAVPTLAPRPGEGAANTLVAARRARVVAVHVRQGDASVREGAQVVPGEVLVRGYLVQGAPTLGGEAGPLEWVAPRAVVMARWTATQTGSASRVVVDTRTVRWQFAWMVQALGRTLGQGGPAAPGGPASTLADWRIRLHGIEWIGVRLRRVGVVERRVVRRSRAATGVAAVEAAERALLGQVGADVRIVSRRTRLVWHGDRVTATVRVEVEGDIARPAGRAPVTG